MVYFSTIVEEVKWERVRVKVLLLHLAALPNLAYYGSSSAHIRRNCMDTDGELHDGTWETLSADILSGMRDWRLQHPKATLREIEQALDERFYRLRTRMLQDLALQSS